MVWPHEVLRGAQDHEWDVAIEFRSAQGPLAQLPALVADLVRRAGSDAMKVGGKPPTFSLEITRRQGTLMNLTTVDGNGRVPDAHACPPTVRGTVVVFSIWVRSTTATEVAPSLASSAIASPPFGL
jgi:hypothetical protein